MFSSVQYQKGSNAFGKMYPPLLGSFLYKYLNKYSFACINGFDFFTLIPSFQIISTLMHKCFYWFWKITNMSQNRTFKLS